MFDIIYERIKELADKRGISINALEDKLDISRGSLCKIDKHKPSSEKVSKLAKELETTSEFILNGEEPEANYSDELAGILAKVRRDADLINALDKYFRLSDEKRKHIINTINMIGEE